MYIQQLYTNCLAQAAYYLESDREAIIVDPLRDPAPYLEVAKSRGAVIKYILETHFHADFVSGHLDLAKATGAEIVFGPDAKPDYEAHIAKDGERIQLGHVEIEVLHTPGHTIESTCFLVYDEAELPHAIFSGDTLFAGDVGRPDLMSGNLSPEILAEKLYHSLQNKIKTLPDNVIVYPGHGAGSACGKNIGKETTTTIGDQKKTNYALMDMPMETFIPLVIQGQSVPPQYFFADAKLNKEGYENFEEVMMNNLYFISPQELENKKKKEAVILLDTRSPEIFAKGFIPGSINIGLDGDFAVWVGTLYSPKTEFLLVTEQGKEKETISRLARIGYENVNGILNGGISSWTESGKMLDRIPSLNPIEFERAIASGKFTVLDVRRPSEVTKKHIHHAMNSPLSEIFSRLDHFDQNVSYIACCAGGYRSVIAASILKAAGIENVYNVSGGVARLEKEKPLLIEETVF
jgi:glyoxylase-like metal-dependent hydrolase (beta-lactamase superfamily II)/rhodanese-related sulfurtransferase